MFDLREYKNNIDRLTDLLPWAALVAPGVVLNKDGSFQCTVIFRGADLESSTESQLISITARLNNALKRLSSGWGIYIEARRQTANSYPSESDFDDPVSWLIDSERRNLFEREGENYESRYFLTFQYLSPKEAISKISALFVKKHESNASSATSSKKNCIIND